MNLDELDRVLDGAREAPLSEADCDKLKNALHALAAMLARPRNTEKTSAVLGEPSGAEPGETAGPDISGAAASRAWAKRSGGVWRRTTRSMIPHQKFEARGSLPGVRERQCIRAEGAEGAGADRGAGTAGGHGVFAGTVAMRRMRAGVYGRRSRKAWGRRSTTRRRRR